MFFNTTAIRARALAAATSAAVAAIGLAGFGMTDAAAQQQRGWFKTCAKQAENDICNTQQLIFADNGQMITAVSLLDISGKVNNKLFQVTVPTGRLIPPGIGMSIDGGAIQKIDYALCFADRCIAEAPLTDAILASLKKGGKVTFTSINFQRQQNPVEMTLEGFTAAYEGEPVQESAVEDRQKKLAEEIEKRQKEFEEKLKAEQEKAKN